MEKQMFEFVKETNFKGDTFWYTTRNGRLVSDSLAYDRQKAYSIFEQLKERGNLDPVRVVEETYEKA